MQRNRVLKASLAALMTFALVATPVMAQPSSFERNKFLVFLPAVDSSGNLEFTDVSEGDALLVTECINTTTGNFIFKICGSVKNSYGQPTGFSNENLFVYDLSDSLTDPADVTITASLYLVYKPCHGKSKVTYTGIAVDTDDLP